MRDWVCAVAAWALLAHAFCMGLIAPASFGAPHAFARLHVLHAAANDEDGRPAHDDRHAHGDDCQACPLGACGMSLPDAVARVVAQDHVCALRQAPSRSAPQRTSRAHAIALPRGPPRLPSA